MKRSECARCGEQQEATTSHKMKRLAIKHWKATGHRTFIKILGWGNYTLPVNPDKPMSDNLDAEIEYEVMTEDDIEEELNFLTREDLATVLKDYVPRNTLDDKVSSIKTFVTHQLTAAGSSKKSVEMVTEEQVRSVVDARIESELRSMRKTVKSLERTRNRSLESIEEFKEWQKEVDKNMGRIANILYELRDDGRVHTHNITATHDGLVTQGMIINRLLRRLIAKEILTTEEDDDIGCVSYMDPDGNVQVPK